MGSTSWSDSLYRERAVKREETATPTFAHHEEVASGRAAHAIHATLNPKGVVVRESRDSEEHPESVPIVIKYDGTGSMRRVPVVFQGRLPRLMELLLTKKFCKDPQILVGCVGDATSGDRAPLQAGQFESGLEIEDNLTNLFLEGGGGPGGEESYQLAMYFVARHTVTDAWEKRGKKGYFFLLGDEMAYPYVRKNEVKAVFDEDIQADIPTSTIVAELQEKWHVFFIIPGGTSGYGSRPVREFWGNLIGEQNVLTLEDPMAVCETIGATIGLIENEHVDLAKVTEDIKDSGESITSAVTKGLSGLAENVALTRAAKASGLPEKAEKSSGTVRL